MVAVVAVVDVVQLACAQADVEPLLWPGGVGGHAGGAHIAPVRLTKLHPLHDSDLTC